MGSEMTGQVSGGRIGGGRGGLFSQHSKLRSLTKGQRIQKQEGGVGLLLVFAVAYSTNN